MQYYNPRCFVQVPSHTRGQTNPINHFKETLC